MRAAHNRAQPPSQPRPQSRQTGMYRASAKPSRPGLPLFRPLPVVSHNMCSEPAQTALTVDRAYQWLRRPGKPLKSPLTCGDSARLTTLTSCPDQVRARDRGVSGAQPSPREVLARRPYPQISRHPRRIRRSKERHRWTCWKRPGARAVAPSRTSSSAAAAPAPAAAGRVRSPERRWCRTSGRAGRTGGQRSGRRYAPGAPGRTGNRRTVRAGCW